jgi:hypothetical protein
MQAGLSSRVLLRVHADRPRDDGGPNARGSAALGIEEAAIGSLLIREFGFFMPMGFLRCDELLGTCISVGARMKRRTWVLILDMELYDYDKLEEARNRWESISGNLKCSHDPV